jgi:hypothetical protein
MQMHMKNGLPGLGAVIEDQTKSVIQTLLPRDLACAKDKASQKTFVRFPRVAHSGNVPLWNHEQMSRRFRMKVLNDGERLVFEFELGRNFLRENPAKKTIVH